MITFIKILRQHHKFLLDNNERIKECPYYKNTHVDLLFHNNSFTIIQPSLGDLLHIWQNTIAHINNRKVFIVSLRESNTKLSGTGINTTTGAVEVGELTLDRSVDSFFREYNIARDFSQFYVPLPYVIAELKAGKTEYHHNVEELTNTFFERLQLEATLGKYDLDNKVRLTQTHDTFYLTINSRFLWVDILNYITEVNLKNKNLLRDHIRQTFRDRGYVDEIFPNRFAISKFFNHPSHLLKEETLKEIIKTAQTFEEILEDFIKGKC